MPPKRQAIVSYRQYFQVTFVRATLQERDKTLAKYLVTGAAGFIGRSIAAALLARGETVRGVDNLVTGRRQNLVGLEDMEFIEGDLADPAVCERSCAGMEIVFHEAALASVPRSVADPVATNVSCVDATLNLLVAARDAGVRRVIYAGSSAAYGDSPTSPSMSEWFPIRLAPMRWQNWRENIIYALFIVYTDWKRWCCATSTCWAAPGSHVPLLRRAGNFLPQDAGWRTRDDLWRRRAKPRLHLH